jgi:hypothetical protein
MINREDNLLVVNKQTKMDINVGNATDGDIFRKTVSKAIILGMLLLLVQLGTS